MNASNILLVYWVAMWTQHGASRLLKTASDLLQPSQPYLIDDA